MGDPTFTWRGHDCMQEVHDQEDLNYFINSGGILLISKQDLMNHLHLRYDPPNDPPDPSLFEPDGNVIPNILGVANSVENTFLFAKQYGLLLERDYPFEGVLEVVNFDDRPTDNDIVSIGDIGQVDDRRHYHIRTHLHLGPLAATLLVNQSFKDFVGDGIYMGMLVNEKEEDAEGHAVLVVGYGSHGTQRYYLIKNSYSEEWGNGGYGKICEDEFRHSVCFYHPIRTRLNLAQH